MSNLDPRLPDITEMLELLQSISNVEGFSSQIFWIWSNLQSADALPFDILNNDLPFIL